MYAFNVILILLAQFIVNSIGLHLHGFNKSENIYESFADCGSYSFKCNNSECISRYKYCDGIADCSNGADEDEKCLNLQIICPEYAFRCNYGACVNGDARCNGIKECHDNSDEESCTYLTQTEKPKRRPDWRKRRPGWRRRRPHGRRKFGCNGQYINNFQLCDGIKNCEDGSDETYERCNQISCPNFTYRCNYGACVDADAKCNGIAECADGSDEESCILTINNFNYPTSHHFYCKNGQYINYYQLCDGIKDCNDGSDEIYQHCGQISCPDFAYRCSYGACVDGDAKCDGIEDCADGSDETPEICNRTQIQSDESCALPLLPPNGNFEIKNLSFNKSSEHVNEYTTLKFNCIKDFRLYPPNHAQIICLSGQWNPSVPQCIYTCPPRVSNSIDFTCELDGLKQNCSDRLIEGTIVYQKCKQFYTQADNTNSKDMCRDGSYDFGYIKCVLEYN